ncbi:MAG: maleylacetoacetate isomerase [Minwuia sp.]|nr:maleylacetoacetate isomerase [Minwuia sp.]
MRLRLHTRHQNSAGERVRIVLNLKGIEYDYVAVASPRSEGYRTINPQGLMPALEIDGHAIAQSSAIVELLEDLYPDPSVFPADPIERARVRAFASLICADLHPLNNQRVRRYLSGHIGASDAAVQDWYAHWIAETFAALEAEVVAHPTGNPFCFGELPTFADACLVPQMANARRFGCDLSPYPALVRIDANCSALDAFAKARPDSQPDVP